jgi:urea carboxylase
LEVDAPPEVSGFDEAESPVGEGCQAINSPMTASVFQIAVELGEWVEAGAKLIVLDAMKTEIVISSSRAGIVEEIRCAPGKLVHAGQALVVLRIDEMRGV